MSKTLYKNARIIDPSRSIDETGGLLIEDGTIKAAGGSVLREDIPENCRVIDCSGLALIPGLVDMRVHVGEPGSEHRETIRSASEAAAAGGVTTIVTMPDTNPVVDDVALVEFILRTARENDLVRVRPAAAMTLGLEGKEMTEYGNLLDAGAVMFTNGRTSIRSASVMRRAMTYARDFDALIDHETRDADLAGDGVMNEGLFASWLGLAGVPREAELLPLLRDLTLAKLTRVSYHAAKISCGMSLEAIARAKSEGVNATAGASIHHLTLNETDIGQYRTFFKMSPPLRAEEDRRAMVEGLKDGTIDIIVSGHDPQDVDTKRLPFSEAANGAVGLETLLAAALRLHHSGDVPLMRIIDALSSAPARRLGIDAGTLQPGKPADFALVDLDEPWVVDVDKLKSRSKNSAYENARFTGKVKETIVGGRSVFRADD